MELPKISAPAIRALNSAGIFTLEEALKKSDKELLALHGFGQKGLRIVRAYSVTYSPDGTIRSYSLDPKKK
jgi:hypothetical protein